MDIHKDYYAVLGVLPSIDAAALTAVCRALLKKHHPDVSENCSADGKAADIIEAYRVLGDAERRRDYDAKRKEIAQQSPRQEESYAVNTRRPPGLLRTLTALLLLGFGMRALVAAGVMAFVAMGPLGSMLSDAAGQLGALNSESAPGGFGGFRFFRTHLQPAETARNVVRHVNKNTGATRDDIASIPTRDVITVRFADQPSPSSQIRDTSAQRVRNAGGRNFAADNSRLFDALYGRASK